MECDQARWSHLEFTTQVSSIEKQVFTWFTWTSSSYMYTGIAWILFFIFFTWTIHVHSNGIKIHLATSLCQFFAGFASKQRQLSFKPFLWLTEEVWQSQNTGYTTSFPNHPPSVPQSSHVCQWWDPCLLEEKVLCILYQIKHSWLRKCRKCSSVRKWNFPLSKGFVPRYTHFPSTMLNSPSEMGKHPHPTTLSVAVTLPLRINSSKTRIMPGRTSGLDGQTVNTLWSIWKQRAVRNLIIDKKLKIQ